MLRCHQLSKTYLSGGRELTVLKDITLRARAGRASSPSSARPAAARRRCSACSPASTGPTARRRAPRRRRPRRADEDARARLRGEKVGFVFQSFQLIPTLTARENVQVPLELRGERRATAARGELLARVGLADRGHHYPAQLSGGEQQRVALARAFSHRPRILFADEPTGNLDAATGAHVIELMSELNRELGTTLVLVTHDPDLAARARPHHPPADGAVVADTRGVMRAAALRPAHGVAREPRRARRLAPAHGRRRRGRGRAGRHQLASPTTCAHSVRDQAQALLGADLAFQGARAPLPRARRGAHRLARRRGVRGAVTSFSARWPTCRARRARGWCRSRRSRPAIRSTARS